jgi:hypothetical protein
VKTEPKARTRPGEEHDSRKMKPEEKKMKNERKKSESEKRNSGAGKT